MAGLPWVFKPVYGLLVDSFPIIGYRRWPYLALCGFASGVCTAVIAYASGVSPFEAALLLTVISLGAAIPDVIIDGFVANQIKEKPEYGSDLQSLPWGTFAVAGLIGYSISGPVIHELGVRGTLGLTILSPALLFLAALCLKETRLPPEERQPKVDNLVQSIGTFLKTIRHGTIWQPALFLFIAMGGVHPSVNTALFYWYTNKELGPGFSEEFMGIVMAMGYVGMLIAVFIYNSYFRNTRYRPMFFGCQVMLCLSGFLDLIIVTRTNIRLGIPDHVFVVADMTISDAVFRLEMMPLMVLAARLCPAGIEATLFAFIMSVMNLGHQWSESMGSLLLHVLGVRRTNYDLLWLAIVIRNLMRLLPLFALRLLPSGGPDQEMLTHGTAVQVAIDSNPSDQEPKS